MRRILVATALALLPCMPWLAPDEVEAGGRGGKPLDLKKVEGIEHFPGSSRAKKMLKSNGFVVLPRFHGQIFSPYIGGKLPYYVTVDSAHRTYHVLFESAIEGFERGLARKLLPWTERLIRQLAKTTPPQGHALAAGHELAGKLVAIAYHLQCPEARLKKKLDPAVGGELKRIEAAEGWEESLLLERREDYAQYKPRGLYAGTPELELYFRAVKWLGRAALVLEDETQTSAALVLTRAIHADDALRAGLTQRESILGWLVGPPDDLTVADFRAAMTTAAGDNPSDDELAAAVGPIRKTLAARPAPQVNDLPPTPHEPGASRVRSKGLRLFPPRRTPDAALFQALHEADEGRALPGALEVAAALGSQRALYHLSARDGKAAAHIRAAGTAFREQLSGSHYGATLQAAALLFDGDAPLLGGGPRVQPAPAKGAGEKVLELRSPRLPAPAFSTHAWHDRLLTTGAASWASLRHAWVLHAKSSAMYMGVTDDPYGAVEPAPRYYAALRALAKQLIERGQAIDAFRAADATEGVEFLVKALMDYSQDERLLGEDWRGMLVDEHMERLLGEGEEEALRKKAGALAKTLRAHLDDSSESPQDLPKEVAAAVTALTRTDTLLNLREFVPLMKRLQEIAERELRGEDLTDADAQLIQDYGKRSATLQFFYGNSYLSPRKRMGFVVDIASDSARGVHREVGVGNAMELYVALPLGQGKHRLYRGGVYSYYEFEEPQPLTDKQWRERVGKKKTPAEPGWTSSYLVLPNLLRVVEQIRKGEMPPQAVHVRDARLARALLERLRIAPLATRKDDDALVWTMKRLYGYANGPLRPQILDAVLQRILTAPDELERDYGKYKTCYFGARAPKYLSGIIDPARLQERPEELAPVLAAFMNVPASASPGARDRLSKTLRSFTYAEHARTWAPLLDHEDKEIRAWGYQLVGAGYGPYGISKPKKGEGPAAELLVAALKKETDPELRRQALRHLGDIPWDVDHKHLPVLRPYLESEDAGLRLRAVELIGRMGVRAELDRFLEMAESDPGHHVKKAAASAVGGALSAADADPKDVARVVALLEARIPKEDWDIGIAYGAALRRVQGVQGADALERLARSERLHLEFRQDMLQALCEVGPAGLPHLFRFTFDETSTGHNSVVGAEPLRWCDHAAEALEQQFDSWQSFGWEMFGADTWKERDVSIARMRKYALRKGYAKDSTVRNNTPKPEPGKPETGKKDEK